jgi:hypothetical protein
MNRCPRAPSSIAPRFTFYASTQWMHFAQPSRRRAFVRTLLCRQAAECGAVTVLYWNKRPLRQRELQLFAPPKLPEWPETQQRAQKKRFRQGLAKPALRAKFG